MTKGKPQTTKNNTAQENLTERLERKETVRGTALTITGGFLWGGLPEYSENTHLNTKE